ncbi:MAG: isocitrate lyase/phosphoenolpyruvate mutase family protein [Caulobacteraceae bacterium]
MTFLDLHRQPGGFIMPNAWDAGSAAVLAAVGFPAIATTSAGIAFSLGRQDYAVTDPTRGVPREMMFERMAEIAQAVPIPVNGDLEAGWGDSPDDVARTIADAIAAGLAGGNIEDKIPGHGALYDEQLAIDRIVAARETIAAKGSDFVLCARTDAIVWSADGLAEAVRRSNFYREAGADLLYAPGASDLPRVELLVREVEGPINVVLGLESTAGNAHALIAAGVKRISVGGSMARATLGYLRRCAEGLAADGGVSFAEGGIAHAELNSLFAA